MIIGSPLTYEVSSNGEILYPKTDKEIKQKFYTFLEAKENQTCNAYELIMSGSWPLIIGLIINILIVVVAFKEKLKLLKILTSINFIMFLSFPIVLYYCEILDDINQIKIGYYIFLFNLVFIFFQAQTTHNTC
jgi:hypothetical protein